MLLCGSKRALNPEISLKRNVRLYIRLSKSKHDVYSSRCMVPMNYKLGTDWNDWSDVEQLLLDLRHPILICLVISKVAMVILHML